MYAGASFSFSSLDENDKHPNKLPFTGTLLLVDQASTKPPHGALGHRIFVSKKVAQKKLSGIIGMAINYDRHDLDSHVTRHKVGVVTRAWMEGQKVKISGFIWAKDFPEAEKDLKGRKDLGLSMELADVYVRDENEDIWHLDDFSFTGATILLKNAAAYVQTDLAARAAEVTGRNHTKGEPMKKQKTEDKNAAARKDTGQKRISSGQMSLLAQAVTGQMSTVIQSALAPVVSEFKTVTQGLRDDVEELRGMHLIHAAADNGDVDEEEDDGIVLNAAKEEDDDDDDDAMEAAKEEDDDDDDMAAARKSDDDDGDDDSDATSDSSASDDSSDMEAMEDLSLEDASQEPGEVNKDASNKGSKTTVTKPPKQGEHFAGNVAKGRLSSAAANKGGKVKKVFPNIKSRGTIEAAALQIGELTATVRQLKHQIRAQADNYGVVVKKLRNRLSRVQAQVERFAEIENRRSQMPIDMTNLAAKAGVDLSELRQSGQKLSTHALNQILAAAETSGIMLEPEQRIWMKMQFQEHGLLEDDVVNRHPRLQ